ncbi:uncharacterized protein BP5553_02139 [Venustampulla echinocandica]|uniref:Uncharacterized protein n=1 Tax=Venustampulla echinocandica TaxID=2656787 RepID=A0A370U308_9HELO|nr:uncharacterized protein BP5553_02139 [Venustampulla echinocandica]RDL42160.1 hypothetical protein BP5553_02139 [Venustampulla echinocandica]
MDSPLPPLPPSPLLVSEHNHNNGLQKGNEDHLLINHSKKDPTIDDNTANYSADGNDIGDEHEQERNLQIQEMFNNVFQVSQNLISIDRILENIHTNALLSVVATIRGIAEESNQILVKNNQLLGGILTEGQSQSQAVEEDPNRRPIDDSKYSATCDCNHGYTPQRGDYSSVYPCNSYANGS